MTTLDVQLTKGNLHKYIAEFKSSLNLKNFYSPKNTSRFVFLCGANKNKKDISERRKAIIEFAKKNLPNSEFFLAEKIFSTLQQEEHKGNLLDIEHEISKFADNRGGPVYSDSKPSFISDAAAVC